jgi:hypothetical protein
MGHIWKALLRNQIALHVSFLNFLNLCPETREIIEAIDLPEEIKGFFASEARNSSRCELSQLAAPYKNPA